VSGTSTHDLLEAGGVGTHVFAPAHVGDVCATQNTLLVLQVGVCWLELPPYWQYLEKLVRLPPLRVAELTLLRSLFVEVVLKTMDAGVPVQEEVGYAETVVVQPVWQVQPTQLPPISPWNRFSSAG
jgi:hypothetical protein